MILKVTSFLMAFFCFAGSIAQTSISEINLSHQFEPDKPYQVKAFGNKSGGEVVIFSSFKLPDTLKTLSVSFWGAKNYKDPVVRIDSLINDEYYLGENNGYHYYEYHLRTDFPLIALEMVTGENTSEVHDMFFDDTKYNVLLYNASTKLPVLERWVKKNMQYSVTDMDHNAKGMYVSQFPYEFAAAYPPMSVKSISDKEITRDSTFIAFDDGSISFSRRGLYLFQSDTTSHQGYGWRLEEDAFPGMNKLEQLIPPLRYITTPDEFNKLNEEMTKTAFDSFWLKLGKEQGAAKSMIGRYYKRVEDANVFFTSYKEGWKTDRGMIYIIYGPPHQVQRTEGGEIWWYGNGDIQQVFQFLRFEHVFYPYNYVLQRDANYRRSWFTAVDLIRNNRF